jgi:hypothetical protein
MTFDTRPSMAISTRVDFYFRLHHEEVIHTRRVMLIFDFLGKIGGLNRLLWTLGGLLIGYLYKDRLAIEITESIYVLKDKGQELPNIQARDILFK